MYFIVASFVGMVVHTTNGARGNRQQLRIGRLVQVSMGRRAALAAVVISLLAPAVASAATVRIVYLPCGHHHGDCPSDLRYAKPRPARPTTSRFASTAWRVVLRAPS
jgi:hypothetical protein